MNIIQRFLNWLRRKPRAQETPFSAAAGEDMLVGGLMRAVQGTKEIEYSCDEVYALLDQYVERIKRGEDPAQFMPLVRDHLEKCPDCREEYETLLGMLER